MWPAVRDLDIPGIDSGFLALFFHKLPISQGNTFPGMSLGPLVKVSLLSLPSSSYRIRISGLDLKIKKLFFYSTGV
jgi:hypothetical protein